LPQPPPLDREPIFKTSVANREAFQEIAAVERRRTFQGFQRPVFQQPLEQCDVDSQGGRIEPDQFAVGHDRWWGD
jgi:hypothetical protein